MHRYENSPQQLPILVPSLRAILLTAPVCCMADKESWSQVKTSKTESVDERCRASNSYVETAAMQISGDPTLARVLEHDGNRNGLEETIALAF